MAWKLANARIMSILLQGAVSPANQWMSSLLNSSMPSCLADRSASMSHGSLKHNRLQTGLHLFSHL